MVYKAIHCDCQKRCIWAEGEGGGGGRAAKEKSIYVLEDSLLESSGSKNDC